MVPCRWMSFGRPRSAQQGTCRLVGAAVGRGLEQVMGYLEFIFLVKVRIRKAFCVLFFGCLFVCFFFLAVFFSIQFFFNLVVVVSIIFFWVVHLAAFPSEYLPLAPAGCVVGDLSCFA